MIQFQPSSVSAQIQTNRRVDIAHPWSSQWLGSLFLSQNNWAGTALIEAAARGYENTVRVLLELGGSNPNAQNKVGNTPLSLAVYKGHGAVVDTLMAYGASVALRDEKGRSALDYANPSVSADPQMLERLNALVKR